jgi:predicted SAM-dependent methyltransferase
MIGVSEAFMRLYIGTGADGLKPDGYTTVDIDRANKPDIVANASDLSMIETDSCEEVYASHVLEHIPWPYVLSTLGEWARVLKPDGVIKISVPDMELLTHMLARGDNVWHVMANFYGGHWATPGGPQGHHYGYTRQMLVEVLSVLGFDDFDHWNSLFREAANGWLYSQNGERLALSLNIVGTKKRAPLVDIPALVERIRHRDIMQPFMAVVRDMLVDNQTMPTVSDIELYQRLHCRYLDEMRRNEMLEQRIRDLEVQR